MSDKKSQFKTSWWIRRAVYVIVGVAGLVAAGFGLIDEGQLDAIAASPLLATVAGFIAAAFTHEGSDSTATAADVSQTARDAAIATAEKIGTVDVDALATRAAEQVADLIDRSFGTGNTPESSLPVYNGTSTRGE